MTVIDLIDLLPLITLALTAIGIILSAICLAFLSGGSTGAAAVSYYLAAYFVTMLIAFGVITILSDKERFRKHEDRASLSFSEMPPGPVLQRDLAKLWPQSAHD